jgi:hypothetical protein
MVARAAEESIGALLLFRVDRNTGRYGTPQKQTLFKRCAISRLRMGITHAVLASLVGHNYTHQRMGP